MIKRWTIFRHFVLLISNIGLYSFIINTLLSKSVNFVQRSQINVKNMSSSGLFNIPRFYELLNKEGYADINTLKNVV